MYSLRTAFFASILHRIVCIYIYECDESFFAVAVAVNANIPIATVLILIIFSVDFNAHFNKNEAIWIQQCHPYGCFYYEKYCKRMISAPNRYLLSLKLISYEYS